MYGKSDYMKIITDINPLVWIMVDIAIQCKTVQSATQFLLAPVCKSFVINLQILIIGRQILVHGFI